MESLVYRLEPSHSCSGSNRFERWHEAETARAVPHAVATKDLSRTVRRPDADGNLQSGGSPYFSWERSSTTSWDSSGLSEFSSWSPPRPPIDSGFHVPRGVSSTASSSSGGSVESITDGGWGSVWTRLGSGRPPVFTCNRGQRQHLRGFAPCNPRHCSGWGTEARGFGSMGSR